MRNCQRNLVIIFFALSAARDLSAEIISEALLSFPSQTEYVEYDNLAALRTLPDYNTLRQRFSGKPLEDAKIALGQLGIHEDQVHEIVSGSSSTAFYGLVAGTFSGELVAKSARGKSAAAKVLENQAFCPGKGTCVVFLEDSLAAFGTLAELKDLLEARQGFLGRLNSNRKVVGLLNSTERRAPVRGVVFGGQLNTAISDMLQDLSGWNRDWSRLSANISAIGYSVKLDSKAHVSATLECTSGTAAALLVQMLSALSSLQSVTGSTGSSTAGMPFQNLQVSSSGNIVDFKTDTAIPNSAPAAR
jgi:hypothetical protein